MKTIISIFMVTTILSILFLFESLSSGVNAKGNINTFQDEVFIANNIPPNSNIVVSHSDIESFISEDNNGWAVYIIPDGGLSVEYPSDWFIKEYPSDGNLISYIIPSTQLSDNLHQAIQIIRYKNTNLLPLNEWFYDSSVQLGVAKHLLSNAHSEIIPLEKGGQSLQVFGIPAVRPELHFFVPSDPYIYDIIITSPLIVQEYEDLDLYNFSVPSNYPEAPEFQFPINKSAPTYRHYFEFGDPSSLCGPLHNGTDYSVGENADVYAVANGQVIVSKTDSNPDGYGEYVIIAHTIPGDGATVYSLYAHLNKRLVLDIPGPVIVNRGDVIGLEGSTGNEDIIHLHFELRKKYPYWDEYQCGKYVSLDYLNNRFYDPEVFIPNHSGDTEGVLLKDFGVLIPWWYTFYTCDSGDIVVSLDESVLFSISSSGLPGGSYTKFVGAGSHQLKATYTNTINGKEPDIEFQIYNPIVSIVCAGGSSSTPPPPPTSEPQPTPGATQPPLAPNESATFTGYETVPDEYKASPGEALVKIWRIRNTGNTTWGSGYQLAFVSGNQMEAPASVSLPHDVAPNQTVDISVNITAPSSDGTYQGNWRMRNPSGLYFGDTIWVNIQVGTSSNNITLTADPPSPASADQVRIYARVNNFPNLRALRVLVDGQQLCELGAPEIIDCVWQPNGYSTGQHSISAEADDWSGPAWDHPEQKTILYELTGSGVVNHAPYRPTLVANPAYDWYATIGDAPQLCAQSQGDPDGDPVTQYRFVATASVGTVDSGWVSSSCHNFGSITPGTYEWHAQVKDSQGAISDWSDQWHFTAEPTGIDASIDHFTPGSPSDAEDVKIYGCTTGHAGENITMRVLVNDANDGTDSGEWHIIKEQGSPCFNDVDVPVWHTLEYADGPHLVRLVAWAIQPDAGDVYDTVYYLNHRRPASPHLVAPVPASQDFNEAIYLNSRTITFRWDPAIRADSYTLHVSTNPSPASDANPIYRQSFGQNISHTSRVSVDSNGSQGNGMSGYSSTAISDDGRFVAFPSGANNLVIGDTNNATDIFVHDNKTGETVLASVTSNGAQSNGGSILPSISADGRFVAFVSFATNLVAGDTNEVCDNNGDGVYSENCPDVFLHDFLTGQTRRVSVSSDGTQGNGESGPYGIELSADGRYVLFSSSASNLVPGDTNNYCFAKDGAPGANCLDVFLYDTQDGSVQRISVASDGTEGDQGSYDPVISADNRTIAFSSCAGNLVPNLSLICPNVFVHDLNTGQTTIVSVSSIGTLGNNFSGGYLNSLSISSDGRYVAFPSYATNLVNNDTNNELDVFLHDRQTGETKRVSVAGDGTEGNGTSGFLGVSVSSTGRYVTFYSEANNLVPGDSNNSCDQYMNPGGTYNCPDVFVHDQLTGQTELVSVDSNGNQGNGYGNWYPSISADGHTISFASASSDLVPGDTNDAWDVFIRDSIGTSVTEQTITFDQDYPTLYWQVTAENDVGTNNSGAQLFGIDRVGPSCSVDPLQPTVFDSVFQVSWDGADNLAGIRSFDIQYKDSERGNWEDWLEGIPDNKTYELFTGQPGHIYFFRCRASDHANNTGSYPSAADASTTIDPSSRPPTPWWDPAYSQKRNITVLNNMSNTSMPVGYPVHLHFGSNTTPTAADLYNASLSNPKCNDLRIIANDTVELNRIVQNCSSSAIDIWFRTQVSVPGGAADNTTHQLYSGNASAGSPPADPNQVWYPNREADTTYLYYLQEGSGATAYDSSGNSHNCSIDPSVQWSSSKFGYGLRLNRANSGDSRSLNCGSAVPLTAFTIEFWYQPDADDGGRIAGELAGGGNGGGGNNWLLQNFGGRIRLDTWECPTCGSQEVESNFSLQDAQYIGKWNHIAVTFNGGNEVKFYINGAFDSTKYLQDSGINTFTPPLEIGSAEGISQIKANLGAFRISSGVKTSFPYGSFAAITNEPTTAVGQVITPTPPGSADLVLLSLSSYPNPSGGVIVEAVVKNQGDLSTLNGFYTDLYLDHLPAGAGDYTGSLRFWVNDPIAPDEVTTLTTILNDLSSTHLSGQTALASANDQSSLTIEAMATYTETSGTLFAQTDSEGLVKEANNENNIYAIGMEICTASPDSFESDDSFASATPIYVGESQTHNFNIAGDQDWIRFEAKAGETYQLSTHNLDLSSDTTLYLFDTDGTILLASNDDFNGSLASQIEWSASTTGRYYALVKHWNPNVGGCGTGYTFELRQFVNIYLPLISDVKR